ncbi:DMT family protein [Stappia sp. MMSF_3263]|uniref:DMT family protein n=1 Tax=Stappia sp. MMSF_3263 TaxID=3046693 RepID=UPI00273F3612|nr:DMT family protein [Stappia sp. MMSF_3263]
MTALPAAGPLVPLATIGLLIASNVFMTFAWYGHLKFKATPLVVVILASWGIAFFEYLLQVPANRIGHGVFSAAELKTIQEVITLGVFAVFSVAYLGEELRWTHFAGFTLIAAGAGLVFYKP